MNREYNLEQDGRVVVSRVRVAHTFVDRALGLMFRRPLPEGVALYIPRCRAVHTFGMRFALDIRFLDSDGMTVRAVYGLKPWRIALGGPGAVDVLETSSGYPAQPISDSRQLTLRPL